MGETKPGADELRIKALLKQRGVGPDAGLPAVPPRLPDEYEPARERDWFDDLADYNAPRQDPRPPAEEPAHTPAPAAEPEGQEADPGPGVWSRTWDAATAKVKPWKALLALAAAVLPIPWTGYSAAVTWAYTVGEARTAHQGFGYALAFGTFLLAARRLVRTRSLLALWCTAVTFIGLFSAMSWYDPINWLTGVSR